MALGLKGFEQIPSALQTLPKPYMFHSCEIGPLAWAGNKHVTIVGGGQSALGLAALLHEVGADVRVLVRDKTVTWNERPDAARGIISRLLRPEGGLGPGWRSHILSECPIIFHKLGRDRRTRIMRNSWGPSGAWWLQNRVVGKIDLCLGTEVKGAAVDGSKVILQVESDEGTLDYATDHVIAATGFRTDIRRHGFLSDDIKSRLVLDDGAPELTSNFETNIPGFYVIGPASAHSFGPVMRFIYGAKHAAPKLTRHILGSAQQVC
jgi:pyruvate/2-oxoglutarate dehydrogenase complex dihydrolipoamide dehydrogenase (E3) component